MKAFHLLVFASLFSIVSKGQEYKRNNVWIVGQDPTLVFNFNGALTINPLQQSIFTRLNSNISDTNGNLLFFCNGYGVFDKNGFYVENGDTINSPYGHVLYAYYGGGGIFDQTSIILPKKGNTYYVFSTGMSDSFATLYINGLGPGFDVLNYSVVDMDSNNGKGKVVKKNVVLAGNQHYNNCAMQAVKHANGKDWWLVKADCYNNRYEQYIVREDTILGPYYQNIPTNKIGDFCYFFGQLYFSNDGTKMASGIYGNIINSNFYYRNGVDIFDFDRCNGKLTFKKNYRVPEDTSTYANDDIKMGICFSPNDSLLYMSNSYSVYQIDLNDTNTNNALFVHGPDTTDLSYFPEYHSMASAHDGKLYIGNWHGIRKYMSYIDRPNIKGLGCDFKPQGLWQPYTNLRTPPNMPNYGLGADSALLLGCEPVSSGEGLEVRDEGLMVYPNPSSTVFYIKNKQGKRKYLFNLVGEVILSTIKDEIEVSIFSKGIYFLRCEGQTKKVIIE